MPASPLRRRLIAARRGPFASLASLGLSIQAGVMTKRPEIPPSSPPGSQALGIGTPGLGGGVLHPESDVSSAMVSKSGWVWETRKGFPTETRKERSSEIAGVGVALAVLSDGDDIRDHREPVGSFAPLSAVVAAVIAGLTVVGCQAAPAPRALTHGNYQPLCLILCEISTALTSSEGVRAVGTGSASGTQTGGTATSSQQTGG